MQRKLWRPFAALETRDFDVADFLGSPISERRQDAVRRHDSGGLTTFADSRVDDALGVLFPGGVETGEVKSHRPAERIGSVEFLIPAINANHAETAVGKLEERHESMLSLRTVVMRRKGLRPRLALIT